MYWAVKSWRKKILRLEEIDQLAVKLKLPRSVVEREIIFYDTLTQILRCSPVPVCLKGGTLISRLYSEIPRFSWDIDLVSNLSSKKGYSLDKLNKCIEQLGGTYELVCNEVKVNLGFFEIDAEKNVFIDLLSLRRLMSTYSVGVSLPRYVLRRGEEIDKLTMYFLRMKKELGFLPSLDYVRLTVSINEKEPIESFKSKVIPSILEKIEKPVLKAKGLVFPPEYCIAEKISRLGKPLELSLRDHLCDLYDLGQLLKLKLDISLFKKRIDYLYRARRAVLPRKLFEQVERNISVLTKYGKLFETRREFILPSRKYEWKEYVGRVREEIREIIKLS